MRDALLALLVAAPVALAPAAAQGGDLPPPVAIRLRYVLGPGTQSCPPEQTLHDEVARRMGYDPFTPDAPDSVVTTLSLSARESRGTVEFHDTGDHRWDDKTLTIHGCNCMVLVTGIAIYISYMFAEFVPTPTAAPTPATPEPPPPAEAPVPLPQPPASTQPAPPLARAARPRPPPPAPSPRRPEIEIGASPLLAFGIAPNVALGAALHIGLRWPSLAFSIALEGRADGPASAVSDALPHPRVQTNLAGGSIIPCAYPHPRVPLCAVATIGRVGGESSGILNPDVDQSLYLGAGLRAGLDMPLSDHLKVRVFGDMLGTIVAAQADVARRDVWHTPLLTGDLGAALLAFF